MITKVNSFTIPSLGMDHIEQEMEVYNSILSNYVYFSKSDGNAIPRSLSCHKRKRGKQQQLCSLFHN